MHNEQSLRIGPQLQIKRRKLKIRIDSQLSIKPSQQSSKQASNANISTNTTYNPQTIPSTTAHHLHHQLPKLQPPQTQPATMPPKKEYKRSTLIKPFKINSPQDLNLHAHSTTSTFENAFAAIDVVNKLLTICQVNHVAHGKLARSMRWDDDPRRCIDMRMHLHHPDSGLLEGERYLEFLILPRRPYEALVSLFRGWCEEQWPEARYKNCA